MRKTPAGTLLFLLALALALLSANLAASMERGRQAAQSSPGSMPSAAMQKLLTAADVESATGMKGVKLVPRDPKKLAGGDLNFAKADGSILLVIRFGDAGMYQAWRSQPGTFDSGVKGIGDEAFCGPKGMAPYVLYVHKGNRAFSLSSFLNSATMKPWIAQDQERAMAKIILSRL